MRTVRPALALGLTAQLVLLAVLSGSVGLGPVGWAAGLGTGAVIIGLLARGLDRAGRSQLGPANRVTLTRAVLVGAIAALVADSFVRASTVGVLVVVAAIALGLDAVDGPVARLTGTASSLGARFDMEIDALLIAILSVFVAQTSGPFVLAIGAARYLYVAAGWALPWLRNPAPPRYWCKVVAAIQGIVLTVATADVLPSWAATVMLGIALALLAESFGREAWWLWRHRLDVPQPRPVRDRDLVTHG